MIKKIIILALLFFVVIFFFIFLHEKLEDGTVVNQPEEITFPEEGDEIIKQPEEVTVPKNNLPQVSIIIDDLGNSFSIDKCDGS